MFARDRMAMAHHTGAGGAREWLAAFGCGVWVGVAAGLGVVMRIGYATAGPLDRGFLAAGNRLVAADAARDAGVHAAAPGKTLAQHVAPMTLCRRRSSATRRSFHSAAHQIL